MICITGSLSQVEIHIYISYSFYTSIADLSKAHTPQPLSFIKTLSSSTSFHIDETFDMLDSTTAAVLVTLRNIIGDFVNMRARHPLATRHERRAVTEQLVHIFEVQAFRLRLEAPEEDSVEEVTDHEDEVEFLVDVSTCAQDLGDCVATHPADRCDCDGGHLADHRVEGKRGHCSP